VPLLVLDGITYRWNHKSIQEYFAALYLSAAGSGTQERVLQSIIDRGRSSAYLNFLLLFIDMDEKAFRHVMIPLLVRILRSEFSHGTQLAGIESKARALRKSLTAFRAQVLVNFELEEFKKIQEKAPVSRHFFTEARRLVVAAGRLPEAWSAEIGPGPRTVVSIHHERFLLLVALSNHLNLEFLKILDPVPKPHAPLKLFWKNFHLLTDDPSDPANSPQEYAVVNEFLIRHVKLVHFDEERAGTLLATILAEIEEEKTIETSF
jgi:hypothetical protein